MERSEVGPGAADALVAGPDGLGVQPYLVQTGTEGAWGQESTGRDSQVSYSERKVQVKNVGAKGARHVREKGVGTAVRSLRDPPQFCLTARSSRSPRLEPPYFRLTASSGGSPQLGQGVDRGVSGV